MVIIEGKGKGKGKEKMSAKRSDSTVMLQKKKTLAKAERVESSGRWVDGDVPEDFVAIMKERREFLKAQYDPTDHVNRMALFRGYRVVRVIPAPRSSTRLQSTDAHVTHPQLKCTCLLEIIGVKETLDGPMMTRGTIIKVNVSELNSVTPAGEAVWGKYAKVTNDPEIDGCVKAVSLSK